MDFESISLATRTQCHKRYAVRLNPLQVGHPHALYPCYFSIGITVPTIRTGDHVSLRNVSMPACTTASMFARDVNLPEGALLAGSSQKLHSKVPNKEI